MKSTNRLDDGFHIPTAIRIARAFAVVAVIMVSAISSLAYVVYRGDNAAQDLSAVALLKALADLRSDVREAQTNIIGMIVEQAGLRATSAAIITHLDSVQADIRELRAGMPPRDTGQ